MPSLEDLAKQKRAEKAEQTQAAAEAAAAAEQERVAAESASTKIETEAATTALRNDIATIDKQIRSLDSAKVGLGIETDAREGAAAKERSAEAAVDSAAEALKEHGVTKDELLSNPEYAEYDEISDLGKARRNSAFQSELNPLTTGEFNQQLALLGVEVPPDATRSQIETLITQRSSELQAELAEKRLQLPEERERVMKEAIGHGRLFENGVITDAGMREFNLIPVGNQAASLEEAPVAETYKRFESLLSDIPLFQQRPDLVPDAMKHIANEVAKRRVEEMLKKGDKRVELRADDMRRVASYEEQAAEAGQTLEEFFAENPSAKTDYENRTRSLERKNNLLEGPGNWLKKYAEGQRELKGDTRNGEPRTHEEMHGRWKGMLATLAALNKIDETQPINLLSRGGYNRETVFELPGGKVQREKLGEEIKDLKAEVAQLSQRIQAMGERPKPGLFNGNKIKEWDTENARLTAEKTSKEADIKTKSDAVPQIPIDMPLGPVDGDLLTAIHGEPKLTVGKLKEFYKEAIARAEGGKHEAKMRERRNELLQEDLRRDGEMPMGPGGRAGISQDV